MKWTKYLLLMLILAAAIPTRAQDRVEALKDSIRSSFIVADRFREVFLHPVQPRTFKGVFLSGEPDVIKLIQTIPGVSTGIEGTSAYYVRGGNFGNNLISLDGTTLYGASHLLGLTGVVPVDVVDNIRFQVGGIPAESGNFTASHIMMESRNGSMVQPSGRFSVSTTMVGISFSTPIIKEKMSFLVSGRYSPLGWEYNKLRPHFSEGIPAPDSLKTLVADLFGKLAVKTGRNGELQVSSFYSMDAYRFSLTENSTDLIRWQNWLGQIRYDNRINDRFSLKARASANNYVSLQAIVRDEVNPVTLQLKSSIEEIHADVQGKIVPVSGRSWQMGLETRLARFNPGAYKQTKRQNSDFGIDNTRIAQVYTIYGCFERQGALLDYLFSVRGNLYHSNRLTRFDPEFRTEIRWHLISGLDVNATFDHLVQYYHTLEGIPTGWSLDVKVPSGVLTPPEKAMQVYGGIQWEKGPLLLTTGAYYKYMRNLVYFMDAKALFSTTVSSWETKVDVGKGLSYGWEVQADVHLANMEGTLAYTLSKTDRAFPQLNAGNAFPAKFDRRHIVSASGRIKFCRSSRFEHGPSTLVSYFSGHYESLQSGTYPALILGMPSTDEYYESLATRRYYSHPNNYRMPYYFRWDIGYYFDWKDNRITHHLNVGIYNLTNRHNAASLYYDEINGKWKQLSIFPIMPSLNYSFTF